MNNKEFMNLLEVSPVIASINSDESLQACLESDIPIIFVLYGNICTMEDIVSKLKAGGKTVLIHVDLMEGLNTKEIAIDYIKTKIRADGIISTKPALIKRAKELSLLTVFRFFVLDSMALKQITKQLSHVQPDVIEILPGQMPKVIKRVCAMCHVPVIAGGLITVKEDVIAALSSGAISISATNTDLWYI